MSNPFQLIIPLKQHTPIIHFQHEQAGATLRATEVKPKLDNYLIKDAFGSDKSKYANFLVGGPKSELSALDYKLSVSWEPDKKDICIPIIRGDRNIPMFFANMGEDYQERGLVTYQNISLHFHSFYPDLLEVIKQHIEAFFACTNFGMRSTKGYGSFTVVDSKPEVSPKFSFFIETTDWQSALQHIDLFYKSMRGGINGAAVPQNLKLTRWDDRERREVPVSFVNGIYMKPLLFLYANDNEIQWEKRTIKQSAGNLFPFYQQNRDKSWTIKQNNITEHEKSHSVDKNWPLKQNHTQKAIVRDVLGLSTDQSWRGYGTFKKSANIVKKPVKANEDIERFASPLTFKPVQLGDKFRIDVFINNPIPAEYLKARFKIEVDGQDIGNEHSIWEQFDLDVFIKDYVKLSRMNSAIQIKPGNKNAEAIKNVLVHIYKQINPA